MKKNALILTLLSSFIVPGVAFAQSGTSDRRVERSAPTKQVERSKRGNRTSQRQADSRQPRANRTPMMPLERRTSETRNRAKVQVKNRGSKFASKKSERQKRYDFEIAQQKKNRAVRSRKSAAAIRGKYDRGFLSSHAVQNEFALHASRKARLVRMQKLAELEARQRVAVRIEILIKRENVRHLARIRVLRRNYVS